MKSWGDTGEIDLLPTFNEITIRTAGRCLIGAEFRGGMAKEFARLYHDLESGINLLAFFAPNCPLPAIRRRDRARARVVELMSNLIAARRVGRANTDDFLDTLIDARNPDGTQLSDDIITGLLLTLLFAGQHTSAVLASWTGVLLMQNPRLLEPLLAEQDATIGAQGVTLPALKQLTRLERCIKEAERLHPPLVMLMRTALQDFVFDGYRVPAADLVMVSPAVSHQIPSIFVDPLRCDPDRFAPPREEDRRTPFGLIGFGGGKHRCIGLAFAYYQIKVIWSILLKRYEFSLIDENQLPNYKTFVVGPRAPCLVLYRARARGNSAIQSMAYNSGEFARQ